MQNLGVLTGVPIALDLKLVNNVLDLRLLFGSKFDVATLYILEGTLSITRHHNRKCVHVLLALVKMSDTYEEPGRGITLSPNEPTQAMHSWAGVTFLR